MTKWTKDGDVYTEPSGRYRIEKSVVDDSWDTGALFSISVQWVRSEILPDGSWTPVELHNRLGDAKLAAEKQL